MQNVYIVTVSMNMDWCDAISIVGVYRNLEDAIKYVSEQTGMPEHTIHERMRHGYVYVYDGKDGYYDISENVLM